MARTIFLKAEPNRKQMSIVGRHKLRTDEDLDYYFGMDDETVYVKYNNRLCALDSEGQLHLEEWNRLNQLEIKGK